MFEVNQSQEAILALNNIHPVSFAKLNSPPPAKKSNIKIK